MSQIGGAVSDAWTGLGNAAQAVTNADPSSAFVGNMLDSATFGLSTRAVALLDSGISHLTTPVSNLVTGGTAEPRSYDQSLQGVQDTMQQEAANHPYAALAGQGAGMLVGGSGVAHGLEEAAAHGVPLAGRALGLMTPVAGEGAVKTLGRMAGTGAAFSAADEYVRQGAGMPTTNTLGAAITGAIAGPVLGVGLSKVLALGARGMSMFSEVMGRAPPTDPLAVRGNKALASLLKGLDPDAAEQVVSNLAQKTGLAGSVAMTAPPEVGAAIREAAGNNPVLAAQLQAANDHLQGQMPATLAGKIEDIAGPANPPRPAPTPPAPPPGSLAAPGQPLPGAQPWESMQQVGGIDRPNMQDINGLKTHRDTTMDKAMDPIRHTPVQVDPSNIDTFTDPDIQKFLRTLPSDYRAALLNRLGHVVDTGNPVNIPLSVLDDIRQLAAKAASKAGTPVEERKFQNLADEVSGMVSQQVPEYGAAIDQYRQHSDYIRGFEHGQTGATPGTATLPDVRTSLTTPQGLAGHAAGITTNLSRAANASNDASLGVTDFLTQNAATVQAADQAWGSGKTRELVEAATALKGAVESSAGATPGRVVPQRSVSAKDIATGGAELATGQTWSFARQMGKIVDKLIGSGAMAPEVQTRVALMLTSTNPKVFAQAMEVLRAARVSERDIGLLRAVLSGIGGASVSTTLTPTGQ